MTSVTQPERGRGTMLPVVAAAAALIALLVFAPLASAATDPLASGTTVLKFNKGFFKKLKKNNVKILKLSPTKVSGMRATFTVSPSVGGAGLDPTNGQGTISLSGGLKFKDGKKNVTLKSLVIDTTTNALNGKVGKKNLKIASLKGASSSRDGFGVDISVGTMKLTGKAASQLNSGLGLKKNNEKVFKSNQVLGSSSSATQPSTVTVLPTGNAKLVTDIGTVVKLLTAGVGIAPIAPATEKLALPPEFTFPITGGTIAPNGTSGTVNTSGGVELSKTGKPSTDLANLGVDMGALTASADTTVLPPGPGSLGRGSIADLSLTGATITPDPSARTITVTNMPSTIQIVTATFLNTTYGTTLAAGDGLGKVSYTVQTQ